MKRTVTATNQVKQDWVGKIIPVSVFDSDSPRLKIENLISSGADINATDPDDLDNTILHKMLAKKRLRIEENVAILVELNADINLKNKEKMSMLNYACCYCNPGIVKELLSKKSSASRNNINDRDANGNTALFSSVKESLEPDGWSSQQIIKMLIKAGASIEVGDTDGRLPLGYACYKCDLEIIKALMLSINRKDINARDSGGRTALFLAVYRDYVACKNNVDKESTSQEIISLLVENNADVNFQDNSGCSPMMLAADEINCVSHLKILLNTNFYIDFKQTGGRDNCTALKYLKQNMEKYPKNSNLEDMHIKLQKRKKSDRIRAFGESTFYLPYDITKLIAEFTE